MRILRRIGRFVAKLVRAVMAHPDAILAAAGVDPRIIIAAQVAVRLADVGIVAGNGLDAETKRRRAVDALARDLDRLAITYTPAVVNFAIETAVQTMKAERP